VIVACATAMALGTASGGWRIMKTMGHRIIKLRPINGFAAETAAAATILIATWLKAPVSTTQRHLVQHHGGRRVEASLRRSLGSRRQHAHRMGSDDPGLGDRVRRALLVAPRRSRLICEPVPSG